jgi:transposase-like protein
MKHARYSAAQRDKAVKMHLDGKTVGEVAKELGIKTPTQIYKWARKAKMKNKAAPMPASDSLEEKLAARDFSVVFKDTIEKDELHKLRKENAILTKKLLALQDVYLQTMGVYKL